MPRHARAATSRTHHALLAQFGTAPFTHADLAEIRITRGQLRAAQGQGLVDTLRRGLFVAAGSAQPVSAVESGQIAIATLGPTPAVVAGRIAGAIHGTPFITPRDSGFQREATEVLVLRDSMRHFGTRLPGIIVRPVDRFPEDVVVLDGIRVTGPLHTAVDLVRMGLRPYGAVRARALPLPEALVVLDATSRHLGDLDPESAQARLSAIRPRFRQAQGIRAFDAAAPFVDPRAESPLESWSRGYMVVFGVPMPRLQEVLVGSDGVSYRVDFCWPEAGVIGEADGLAKYGDDPQSFRRAKAEELARQRALEGEGWRFVRWTWEDIAMRPYEVMAEILRALSARPLAA